MRLFVVLALASCTACAAPTQTVAAAPAPEITAPSPAAPAPDRPEPIAAACAQALAPETPLALPILAAAISALPADPKVRPLPAGVRIAGAWHLTAENANFGGLSGLARVPGGLLAVSDGGAFVWINLDGGAPDGTGALAYMRAADGLILSGKQAQDAEGLAWRDGAAFVSFERDHRIERFDLGACGAAARAVRVAALPATIDGRSVPENEGAEALWLGPAASLNFGYEMDRAGRAPIGTVPAGQVAQLDGKGLETPPGLRLVGADTFTDPDGAIRRAVLFRGYSPFSGARVELAWGEGAADRLRLEKPWATDNFEGVAAEILPGGQLRLWLISDDNFSASQRTLLYAFDVNLSPP
jgi:hypothetical protein